MYKLPRFLLLLLLPAVLLAACNNTPPALDPADNAIISFTATGLDKGEGEWLLSWQTRAAEVTLNNQKVEQTGTLEVAASSGEHVLIASTGDERATERVRVGPITGVSISDANGRTSPFVMEPGETLQLNATVAAVDASFEPLQAVNWHVEPEGIAQVNTNGLVTATGVGSFRVYATSQQWTGRESYAEVTSVRLPRIHSFQAEPVIDGNGSWRLSWSAEAEESITLNGQPVSDTESLVVTPTGPASYELVARNDEWTAEEAFTIAPVDGFAISGLGEPAVIGQEESVALNIAVTASGSTVPPGQSVTLRSADPDVLRVTDSGVLTGIAAGTTTVTVTSNHDNSISATLSVEVLATGLYALAAEGNPATLEAGEVLNITWHAVALESLSITPISNGNPVTTHQILPPSVNRFDVVAPLNEGSVDYRFSWVDADGVAGNMMLWGTERRVLGWVCNRPSQVIEFDDPRIRAEIARVFGSSSGLTCADVQRSFTPNTNEWGQELHNMIGLNRCGAEDVPAVTTLEGLQHLTQLVRLELECNNISDIRRLSSMTGLVEINFDNNDIEDVSPLSGLSNVTVLGLYNNNVARIDALAGLTNLEILYLSENRVLDVTPLSRLTSLEHIWLFDNCAGPGDTNCLRDLNPLNGLTNVISLVFHMNDVESLDFINSAMDSLELVLATGNRISDAGPLAVLPRLTTVAIDGNFLTTLQPLVDNSNFPIDTSGYFFWRRGTVQMPPAPFPFEGHLAMGNNCFNPESPEIAAQILELRNRGAEVAGVNSQIRDCVAPASSRTLAPYLQDLREQLRSPY